MTKVLNHHPTPEMLVEFSAGTLDTATSICVASHLHFCKCCRDEVARLDEVGSQLMAISSPETIDDALFDKVMAKIDEPQPVAETAPAPNTGISGFPMHVNKLIHNASKTPVWKRLSSSMEEAKLFTGQNRFEVALHKICAGGVTPKHDHRGLEYTVVLKGSFSDESSVYTEGDFIIRQPGDVHQPMGAKNGECICLSVQEAPIKLTSFLGFFLNPWLKIKPA
jgi:putative transcriptional regulator